MVDLPHFVYLVSAECDDPRGLIKVGISKNVDHRTGMLQTASPFRLTVFHSFEFPNRDSASAVERCFHDVHSKHRSYGEWFRMQPKNGLFLLCLCVESVLHSKISDLGTETIRTVLTAVGVDSAYEKVMTQ